MYKFETLWIDNDNQETSLCKFSNYTDLALFWVYNHNKREYHFTKGRFKDRFIGKTEPPKVVNYKNTHYTLTINTQEMIINKSHANLLIKQLEKAITCTEEVKRFFERDSETATFIHYAEVIKDREYFKLYCGGPADTPSENIVFITLEEATNLLAKLKEAYV